MDRSEQLMEAMAQRDRLRCRYNEARALASASADPKERHRQTARAKILLSMYKEAVDEVARLEGRSKASIRKKDRGFSMDASPGATFGNQVLWQDLAGMKWGDFNGLTWNDIIQAKGALDREHKSTLLTQLLEDAMNACTDRQRCMIQSYYGPQAETMEEIAERFGVKKSTVSRIIKRGLARVAHHTVARLHIALCIDETGRFDYIKFARECAVLTERQMEIVYLFLTGQGTMQEVGDYVARNKSSVCRCVQRSEANLAKVRVDFIPRRNVTGVKIPDWTKMSQLQLAERMGLSYKFAYAALYRGVLVRGMPPLEYHAACLMYSGASAAATGKTLGCSASYAKRAYKEYLSRLGGTPPDPELLPPYQPDQIIRAPMAGGSVLAALRDLTRGYGVLRLDEQILDKALKEGRAHAGT